MHMTTMMRMPIYQQDDGMGNAYDDPDEDAAISTGWVIMMIPLE